jgi:superfamily II DNA helicase RecQ
MNIKVFNIRLSKEFCQVDQDRLNEFLETVEVKLTSTNFVTTNTKDYWSAVIFYIPKMSAKGETIHKLSIEDLNPNEQIIFAALRKWRNNVADKLECNAFRICHNSHLIAIAKSKPKSIEAIEKVVGFGNKRTMKYGKDILEVLKVL